MKYDFIFLGGGNLSFYLEKEFLKSDLSLLVVSDHSTSYSGNLISYKHFIENVSKFECSQMVVMSRFDQLPNDLFHRLMVSLGYAGLVKFGKITYLSSVAVYPSSSRSLSEFDENPVTEYGHFKLEIEERLAAILGESLTVLRVSNLYGANQVSKLESEIVRCIRNGNILKLPISNVVRDFVHVCDLVTYFISFGLGLPSGVYNFASGKPTSLIHFVNEWSRGFSLKLDSSSEDPLILDSVINNSKFENKTNFTFTTLDVGIPLSRKALL
jgi:hypothetical protein